MTKPSDGKGFVLPDTLLGGAVVVVRPTDLRSRVGLYMMEHGCKIGVPVDCADVQNMITEFVAKEVASVIRVPRCPKCGADFSNEWIVYITAREAERECRTCHTRYNLEKMSDFFQFFAPQPLTPEQVERVREIRAKAEGYCYESLEVATADIEFLLELVGGK